MILESKCEHNYETKLKSLRIIPISQHPEPIWHEDIASLMYLKFCLFCFKKPSLYVNKSLFHDNSLILGI